MATVEVGSIVEGVVTGITNFGAFIKLPNGKTGLVHISEIADAYVKDIRNYVSMNESVKVKVLSFDDGGEKIGLSIRQAQEGGSQRGKKRRRPRVSFEDRLAKFMKESDKKHADIRRGQKKER
jgi:S1 RNA binding domain protein